ncbi:MAG TPA: hypothetical protein VJY35_05120 [Candidatus Eisenbacteria bacterium]|nr:hypothetical protein [Candidatus Eisenbacteria bacterium]
MSARLVRVTLACALLATLGTRAVRAAEPAGPRATEIAYTYDYLEHVIARPIARQLDLGRGVRRLSGNPRQAANVDADDQVRLPSTWWTPRLGFRPVSVEQMLQGPGPGTGPAPGKLTVVRAKTQGITPGFFVKDAEGTGFLLKFDPPGLAEMATGADAVGAYLYWAAGYNVADNSIFTFTADDLELSGAASVVDEKGTQRAMDRAYLLRILDKVPRGADGRYRALASRLLSGRPLGPFEYAGRRRDDPEDMIPHQHRRELRGLWTIAAWTNHVDVRSPNSLDMWVTENGRSFVRHHLIDFGSSLGSGATAKRAYRAGTEYYVDYGVMARQLVTLGLRPYGWERAVDPEMPSIGFIDSDTFDPDGWRPEYPNAAFDERTGQDIRWGARIVAAFTDEHIRAAVAQGRYSDPRAAEYLARVLIERRDKIVRRWLSPPAVAARH